MAKHAHNRKGQSPAGPAHGPGIVHPAASLPIRKKLLFGAVACAAFLVLVELILALVGVKPVFYKTDPYVGFAGEIPLFVRDPENPAFYVTAKNKSRHFNVQRFQASKPAGGYRIFCLGGSTTYGHPYQDPTSFCGWLRVMLPKADPSRQWELVNAGGISYASYRVAKLMEELIRCRPDLIIVYTGHNEFLEQRTYPQLIAMPEMLRSLGALLSRTRIHTALKTALDPLRKTPRRTPEHSELLSAEVSTVLDKSVGPEAYQRDDELQAKVLAHYRYNLARMVDIAQTVGSRIIFATPASNLRACSPFKSQHRPGLTQLQLQQWQTLFSQAAQAERARNPEAALAALDQAQTIDPRYALLHYARGKALWELKRFAEAKDAFTRALDEDVCPLRALTAITRSVGELAAQRGVPVVDFVRLVASWSEHGIPGDDWFLDHVHPTVEGNRRLALAFMEVMRDHGWMHPVADWNEAAQQEVKRQVESQLDSKAQALGLLNLAKVIAWAGKHAEAYRLAQRAVDLAPADPNALLELGKNAGLVARHDEAIRHCRKAIELNPRFVEAYAVLGNSYAAKDALADAIRAYEQALQLRPNDADLHNNIGVIQMRQGRDAEAAAHLRQAISLAPSYGEARVNLGLTLTRQGKIDEALQEYREAIRTRPGLPGAISGLAWLLATHPDTRKRNPMEAIRLSEHLVDMTQGHDWQALDTLAAAYAAAGRYPEAASAAERALKLVRTESPSDSLAVSQRLDLYRAGKPYLERSQEPNSSAP